MTDDNPYASPSGDNHWGSQPPPVPDPRFGAPAAPQAGYSPANQSAFPPPYQPAYQPQQYPTQYPPQQYPPQQYPTQYPPQQYPPQQYPPQQYPPVGYGHPSHAFQGNLGLGVAQIILSGLLVVGTILRAATAHAAMRAQDQAVALGFDPRSVHTAHDAVGILFLVVFPLWIVGALWISRARSNAAALAPHLLRRSEVWCWLAWIVPIVQWWFPKQLVDDSWRITAAQLPPTSPGRFRDTRQWWGFWVAFSFILSAVDRVGTYVTAGSTSNPHPGVSPGLETLAAVLGIVAFALWVPVVLGVSRAQEELARQYAPAPWR